MNTFLLSFTGAALVSLFVTRLIRDAAIRVGWVDRPDAARKLHAKPIPAVGGIAIVAAMTAGLTIAAVTPTLVGRQLHVDAPHLLLLAALGLVMMLVGLWDDLDGLSPYVKFGLQIAIASGAWMAGVRIAGWDAAGVHFGFLSLPITVLWIVAITNAFNLLDGVDGLAAGASLFATITLLIVSITTGNLAVATILSALAGASAGFLRYNFNPASIFLGDSGSLFLGFSLAVLSIESSTKSTIAFAIAVPIVSLGLPVLDTTVVVLRRLISRQPLFRGDRRHIHHLLLDRGMSPRDAVMLLYAVCGLLGLLSLLIATPSGRAIGPLLAILGIAAGIGIQQLRIPELRALNAHVVRSVKRQSRLLAGSALVHALLDALASTSNGRELLIVLGDGLDRAGFVSARLTILRPLDLELNESGWRDCGGAGAGKMTQVLEWTSSALAGHVSIVTMVVPLSASEEFGQLALLARSDDPHHAAMISWLASDIGRLVGTHLARVGGAVAVEAADVADEDTARVPQALPATQPVSVDVLAVLSTPQESASARLATPVVHCPKCVTGEIHRSKARNAIERIRKTVSVLRPYRCDHCGWRAWILPLSAEASGIPVDAAMAPDFAALDAFVSPEAPRPQAFPGRQV